ncbi:HSF-type DNA-binding-domain-containing protein [Parasitella parasitica]|nr:HSF-type DNA-binding-domain-containing protein [Parasitella parasitica]
MESKFHSCDSNTMRSFLLSNPGAGAYSQSPPSPQPTTHADQTPYASITSQPVQIPQKSTTASTFVHKLYNMVLDDQFQHLIAWNYTGASFIVCNIMEFARDVLPKHFKHNNFSSFVRQLNMYGFHKVNKSPRGHRTLAENQIWEFSHSRFIRDRSDLLDEIKRKTMESDTVRRETDLHAHMAMMQMSQSDMLQQINHLHDTFNQIVKELHETKQKQEHNNKLVKNLLSYITQQNGGQIPHELGSEFKKLDMNAKVAPSIFITTHQDHFNHQHQPLVPTQSRPNSSLLPSATFPGALIPSPNPTHLATASSTSLDKNFNYFQTNSTSQSPSQVLAAAQAAASVTMTLPDILNSPTPSPTPSPAPAHQTDIGRNNRFSFNNSSHHSMNG